MSKLNLKTLASAIYEAAEGKTVADQKKVIHAALLMLKKSGMAGKADELVTEFQKIDDETKNIVRAVVMSRNQLTEKERGDLSTFIKEEYKADQVVMEEKIDERVLGGVKVKVEDTLYDGTLRTKLNQLQAHLTS